MLRERRARGRQSGRWSFVIVAAAVALVAAVAAFLYPEPAAPVAAAASSPQARIPVAAGQAPLFTLPDGEVRPVRSLLNITAQMQFGDYAWNEDGVPSGPVWVRVDLARQVMSVFRAGHEIGTAVILYGTDGKPTPTGVFHVLERAARHRSNLYDAEMPFMLRLTSGGVAIHASNVRQGYATHGCIGVPFPFARLLYAQVRRGDLVAIVPPARRS